MFENYSLLLDNLLPGIISYYERESPHSAADLGSFLHHSYEACCFITLPHFVCWILTQPSNYVQALFLFTASVICQYKIRNGVFLIAIIAINLSSRVGRMFVHNDLIVCLLHSFLIAFLPSFSTHIPWAVSSISIASIIAYVLMTSTSMSLATYFL